MKKLIISVFFVFLFLVSYGYALDTPGCCLITNSGDFCVALASDTGCATGNFIEGNIIINADDSSECQPSVSLNGLGSLCGAGCSVIEGEGNNGILKIQHINEKGDEEGFYPGQCVTRDVEPIACVFNGINCVWGMTAAQCGLDGGSVDRDIRDSAECRVHTESNEGNFGCCLNSCSRSIRTDCSGSFISGNCADVSSCIAAGCGYDLLSCDQGGIRADTVILEDTVCGGEKTNDCGINEYCCVGEAGCPSNGCKIVSDCGVHDGVLRLPGSTWCDVPSNPEEPGQEHFKMRCPLSGGEPEKHRCGEFRSEICLVNGAGDAECVDNKAEECFNRGFDECEDDIYSNHCKLVGENCLPIHPLGFRFWDCPPGTECNVPAYWDRVLAGKYETFMCSVETSALGCLLSGDCIAIGLPILPELPEEEPEPISLPDGVNIVLDSEWALGSDRFRIGPSTTDYWVNIFFKVPENRGRVTMEIRNKFTNTMVAKPIDEIPFNQGKYRLRYALGEDLSTGTYTIKYIFGERQPGTIIFENKKIGEMDVQLIK